MARRIFTYLVLVLGLLSSITESKAQQVKFSISPATVTPAVGDTVTLNIVVSNFTAMEGFSYTMEWDASLFQLTSFARNGNLPDTANLNFFQINAGTINVAWNSSNGYRNVADGLTIFTLRLKTLATSPNYWMQFSGNSTPINIAQNGVEGDLGTFGFLGIPPAIKPLGLATTSHTIPVNQKVCVGIVAQEFSNVRSAKWAMKWDSTVLRFDSVSVFTGSLGLTVAANFNVTTAVANGRLNFNYVPTTPKTVPNGDTLYKICYTTIGANGTSTPVAILTAGSEIIKAVGNSSSSATVTMTPSNGTVSIVNPVTAGPLTFVATNEMGNIGDTVCVRVYVKSPKEIGIMQFGLRFDSSRVSLVKGRIVSTEMGVETMTVINATTNANSGSMSFIPATNGSGTVKLLWTDNSGNGLTSTLDSLFIMEFCFRIDAGSGTTVPFRFDAYPFKIKKIQSINADPITGNFIILPAAYTDGSIKINGAALPPITDVGVITNVSCNGGNDGKVVLTPSGGNGTYTYAWTGPTFTAASKDIMALKAGKYFVTISSGSALPKVDSFVVTQPTALSATKSITNVACFGQSTGVASIIVSGGTSPYTYLWSSTETVANLSGKAAGQYTVVVTDAKSCIYKDTVVITQPAVALSLSNTIKNISCKSGNDGAINLSVAGGTPTYTYSWTGPSYTFAGEDPINLKAGDYFVTVSDSKSCAQTLGPLKVTEPDSLKIGTPSVTNADCGQNNGAITVTVTGGTGAYTYAWTGPNSFTSASPNLTAIAVGSYVLTVKDAANCSVTFPSISVSPKNANLTVVPSVTNINCNGGSTGAISLVVTGGSGNYTYLWSGPGTSAQTKDITGLKAGNYSVSISDGPFNASCAFIPPSITLTEPTALAVAAPQITNVKCKGDATGAVSINVTGGTSPYTVNWTGPTFTASNTSSITALKAGVYNATILDAKNCPSSASATVTEPTTALSIGSPSVTNVLCFGTLTGKIVVSVSGGTLPYTFSWTGSGTSSQQNLDAVAAGTYKLKVTDANNCSVSTNDIIITQPASAVVASGVITQADGGCNGKIALTVTGGTPQYSYVWTGFGTIQGQKDQADLCTGDYSVVVRDANGCSDTRNFRITGSNSVPIKITDSVVVNAGCLGGTLGKITVNFVGGKAPYTFAWFNINAPNSTIGILQNIDGLGAGKYRLKITDAISQSYLSGEFEIKSSATPINITVVKVTPETCNGNDGKIDIDVLGGAPTYTYSWSSVPVASQDLNNLSAGTYSVTVSDQNKCIKTEENIVVTKILCPLTSTAVKTQDVSCFGGKDGKIKVDISNGEPGYVIKWSPPTANNDSTVRVNNPSRKDGSYEIANLTAGTYIITITDAKSQTNTFTVVVAQPALALTINSTVQGDSSTCTGSIVLNVTGGTPQYQYRWNDLQGANQPRDRFNLCADKIFSVEVTDAKGCFISTANIKIPNIIGALTIGTDVIITNANCADDKTNTLIDITVSGGVRPYKYVWSDPNNSTTEDLSRVLPGLYTVTVTDASLPTPRKVVQTFEITSKSKLQITVATTPASDINATDGSATATIVGNNPPYTIKWSNGPTSTSSNTTFNLSGLKPDNYTVTITDNLGCTKTATFTIISTACADVRVNTTVKCFGKCEGSATVSKVNDAGINPAYSYIWSSGEKGVTAVTLCAGANTVTITGTGANSKTCVASFIVKGPEQLRVSTIQNVDECSITAVVRGGTPPYKYTWTTPNKDSTPTVKDLLRPNTPYFVIVSDANQCTEAPTLATADCREYCLLGMDVITPDDDGKNDIFKVTKCQYTNVRLQVYNRWGQLVYENVDYNDQWEGRNLDGKAGQELPDGVYFFVLRAVSANGIEKLNKGTVSLIRR